MKNSEVKSGNVFKIDTYRVSQYTEKRVVDIVSVLEDPKKNAKKVLVYSPSLNADVLVFINDLKKVS